VHKLDYEIAAAAAPQTSQTSFSTYINQQHELTAMKEERDRIEQQAQLMEQVITLSAVNQSATFTTTTHLITAMQKESTKLRKELQELVSMLKYLFTLT